MNEITNILELYGAVKTSFVLGFLSVILYGILFSLGEAWLSAWAWIDDSKKHRFNPINVFVMDKFFDYKVDDPTDCWYRCKKGSKSSCDGDIGVVYSLLAAAIIPSVIIITIISPITVVVIASIIILAHLARYARRHKKLFDKHVKDKDAHN